MPGLAATSSSDGFSLPVLVAAAAAAIAGLGATSAAWVARRPPHVDGDPPTMDLGPEPPAIAALLCNDYDVRAETAPATLLDLAARNVIALEEVQPGETICRVPPESADSGDLERFERHVLTELRTKAVDGVIPATALTTGTEDASVRWHRELARLVVADAQARGLTVDRWPRRAVQLVGGGVVVILGLFLLAAKIGGNAGDHPAVTGIAVAVTFIGAALLTTTAGRMQRSLAQRPTPTGLTTEARWLGVRAHLAQNEQLPVLPAASVKLYGRHFAYAAGFGLADHAVAALPFGEEDDHLAWSAQGGHWRRVRVRYPRVRPPAWGRRPALATLQGVIEAGGAGYLIARLVGDDGTVALVIATVLAFPFLWGLWTLSAAIPDLFTTHAVTGTVLRCRTRSRTLSTSNAPKYWYYVAIDDGTRDRIAAFRVSEDRYQSVRQGQTVTAEVTPHLGYVRTLR